jgi:hypothetical protein
MFRNQISTKEHQNQLIIIMGYTPLGSPEVSSTVFQLRVEGLSVFDVDRFDTTSMLLLSLVRALFLKSSIGAVCLTVRRAFSECYLLVPVTDSETLKSS